jgi:peptidoglycan hydrolase CwlO-like protein
MWRIFQEVIPWALIVLVLTQYVWPILAGEKTWSLFSRKDKTQASTSLSDEVQEAKKVVDDVKEKVEKIKEKVDEHYKSAEQLKKESGNLL